MTPSHERAIGPTSSRTSITTGATPAVASAAPTPTVPNRKVKPFFRKERMNAIILATPPVTPPSDDDSPLGFAPRRKRNAITSTSNTNDEDELRRSVPSIDVPVTPQTVSSASTSGVRSTDDSSSLERIDSGVSDLTGVASATATPPTTTTIAQQDPPARIVRTPSVEAAQSTSSQSGGGGMVSRSGPRNEPPQSLVTKVLGIVDLSCVSTGLMLDDDTFVVNMPIAVAPPSRPEWGVAPIDDASSTGSLELAGSGTTDTAQPLDDTGSPFKRHETFELVYRETPPTTKQEPTSRRSLWSISKQLFQPKMPAPTTTTDESEPVAKRTMPKSLKSLQPSKPKPHWRLRRRSKSHSPVRVPHPSIPVDSSLRGILETVPEETDDETSFKVRVPGVEMADSFISDRDLIGSEVVDEIYSALDEAIALEAFQQKQCEGQQRELAQTVPQVPPEPVAPKLSEAILSHFTGKPCSAGYREFVDSPAPQPVMQTIVPPITWKRRLGLAKASEVAVDENELVETTPRTASDKRKKALWKPAIDPATGRTYYFHKKTRETTWAKPPDEEICVPKKSAEQTAKQKEGATPENVQKDLGDLDASFWEKKQETPLSPSDEASVRKLVSGCDREEERTTQLLVIAESKPFDEPVQTSDDHPDDEKKTMDENCLLTRSRTGMSIYSGFSGRYSHKSRISELTQQIKNTSSNKPTLPVIPDQALSLATSISTKLEELPHLQATSIQNTTKIPKNIPVPRLRELNVEEFTTSDRVYGGRGTLRPKPVRPGPDASTLALQPEDSNVIGDDEDTDADKSTVSYAATDSISALSEADLSFLDRKEASDDARRRALDRAIVQEDWDLAAQLSEGMRNSSKSQSRQQQPNSVSREAQGELAESEIDRFISDNDWEAMAAYIARLRASATEAGQKKMRKHLRERSPKHRRGGRGRPAAPSNHSDTSGASNPQKRFGARSQLQHDNLPPSTADSYSSYSSTYDSEYTSESYNNYDDNNQQPAPPTRQRQPKAFAC